MEERGQTAGGTVKGKQLVGMGKRREGLRKGMEGEERERRAIAKWTRKRGEERGKAR